MLQIGSARSVGVRTSNRNGSMRITTSNAMRAGKGGRSDVGFLGDSGESVAGRIG